MAYNVEDLRRKLKENSTRKADPNEFRPAKATKDKSISYRFFILPPLVPGDTTITGPAKSNMNLWFVSHGMHWFQNKPQPCPRLYDGSECAICNHGFELMKALPKDQRKDVAGTWMPRQGSLMNIYFPPHKDNPVELHGRVMWYNANRTIHDLTESCVMTEDAGDEDDPRAYGAFFDETNAHMFHMLVKFESANQSYKSSRFMPKKQPIAGTPAEITAILNARHDLVDHIDKPNAPALERLLKSMMGDDSQNDSGFDEPASESKEQVNESKKPESKPEAKKTTIPKPEPPKTTANVGGDSDESDDIDDILRTIE